MKPARIGCAGWQYDDWRGAFYPDGLAKRRWLEHYSRAFDTVEVNSTFYRLASPKAVAGWVEQTPPEFEFAVKASRYLTHVKRLTGMREGVKRIYAGIEPLVEAGKLGPVLWQLPESFHRDDERLGEALEALPDGRQCFEFRHESWFTEEVYELLRAHDVALVIADDPDRRLQPEEITAGWTYVRFHRGSRGREGNYSDREIADWAKKVRRWRRKAAVYAYFNNDWRAYAPRNATKLGELAA